MVIYQPPTEAFRELFLQELRIFPLQTLLTRIVAKGLYGGFRRSKKLNSKLMVNLHDLLSVPTLERRVIEFLQKAKLHEAIDDHDELLRSHDLHFRAISCVMCVGYSFNLDDVQLLRFLNVARRALRLMRRTIRSMVKARRRCILDVISEATQLQIRPDDFGPLECRADRKPALFNYRFFAVLEEAVKKKSRSVEYTC